MYTSACYSCHIIVKHEFLDRFTKKKTLQIANFMKTVHIVYTAYYVNIVYVWRNI